MHPCTCPRCQSPNVTSNRLDPIHIERTMQAAQAVQTLGIPRLSILAGLGAVAIRAVDALRKDSRCMDCGYVFDA